jgi:hypothetical protein
MFCAGSGYAEDEKWCHVGRAAEPSVRALAAETGMFAAPDLLTGRAFAEYNLRHAVHVRALFVKEWICATSMQSS